MTIVKLEPLESISVFSVFQMLTTKKTLGFLWKVFSDKTGKIAWNNTWSNSISKTFTSCFRNHRLFIPLQLNWKYAREVGELKGYRAFPKRKRNYCQKMEKQKHKKVNHLFVVEVHWTVTLKLARSPLKFFETNILTNCVRGFELG